MRRAALAVFVVFLISLTATAASTRLPQVVRLTATLDRPPQSDALVAVTFAIYRDQEGGVPLWTETQNVEVGADGRFEVALGAATTLPVDLFLNGEARWLGIQQLPALEQPRILLAAVPYALKAVDAETLGGRPLSAFVLVDEQQKAEDRHTARQPDSPSRPATTTIIREPAQPAVIAVPAPSPNATPGLTGFQLGSVSGATSIGFGTAAGAWNVYLKNSSASGFDPADLRMTLTPTKLSVLGEVESKSGGIRFPDGSLQSTAVFGTGTSAHGSSHVPNGADPIPTGTPVSISTANTAGTANTLSRSDHVHDGSLFSLATHNHFGASWNGTSSGAAGLSVHNIGSSGTGLYGRASGATGTTYAGYFLADDTAGANHGVYATGGEIGVFATATATSGVAYGVYSLGGTTASSNIGVYGGAADFGVQGEATARFGRGVQGSSSGEDGMGVVGSATGILGTVYGGYFSGGVTTATNIGVAGTAAEIGVKGTGSATTGVAYGGYFEGGTNAASNYGLFATGEERGVSAESPQTGVYGSTSGSGSDAFFGTSFGVLGKATGSGVGLGAYSTTGNAIEAWRPEDIFGDQLTFRVEADGDVGADGAFISNGYDLAEKIDSTEGLAPGDVVEIDPDNDEQFRLSTTARSSIVAGVVSTDPGLVLGDQSLSSGAADERRLLALAGRVPVKVTTENGPIRRGDLLVSASTPGHAMRADANPAAGTVIGKALQPLESDQGTIVMLVMLR